MYHLGMLLFCLLLTITKRIDYYLHLFVDDSGQQIPATATT